MNKLRSFFLGILFFGCAHQTTIEQKMFECINESCTSYPCSVVLSDIFKRDWKKLYVFKPTATLEDIENAIGFHYPFWEDVGKRFIFVDSNNQIVYHEVVLPNYNGTLNESIIFPMRYDQKFIVYLNAPFGVDKIEMTNGHYFTLVQ